MRPDVRRFALGLAIPALLLLGLLSVEVIGPGIRTLAGAA
jgi:hypothetical protein